MFETKIENIQLSVQSKFDFNQNCLTIRAGEIGHFLHLESGHLRPQTCFHLCRSKLNVCPWAISPSA